MQSRRDERSHHGWCGVLRWAERLLVIAGVALLGTWALLVADAQLAQRRARHSLETVARPVTTIPPREADGDTAVTVRAPIALLQGTPVGALSIPRVHLSAVVLHGSDSRTLRRGPGHLENTALPGDSGNVVIAGHRDSFFRPLKDVRIGDDVFVETPGGSFRYRVTSLRVVKPSDVSVLDPTEDAVLTLVTCYPFWMIGDAPDRYVVRAVRVGNAPEAIAGIPASTTGESNRDGFDAEQAVPESPVPAPVTAADDDTLVQEAIERYRVTYNGRLITRHGVGEAPLIFHACQIAVVDDTAEADCGPSWRTFMLRRVDGRWAISSVVVQ